eukprot:TRINITY_DN26891_c0_g1_i1.p1 TRINITY_DN26891_c0_g1~~TRINITY_DN26891_c0_g1_i1.p1  ORF type:complete len:110 (+),score=36.83 TRINITY_DN26891_c0_g1_i1:62-391(+)
MCIRDRYMGTILRTKTYEDDNGASISFNRSEILEACPTISDGANKIGCAVLVMVYNNYTVPLTVTVLCTNQRKVNFLNINTNTIVDMPTYGSPSHYCLLYTSPSPRDQA